MGGSNNRALCFLSKEDTDAECPDAQMLAVVHRFALLRGLAARHDRLLAHTHPLTYADCCANTDADPHPGTHRHGYRYADNGTHSHRSSHAHRDRDTDCCANTNADARVHGYANADGDGYANANVDPRTHGNTDPH